MMEPKTFVLKREQGSDSTSIGEFALGESRSDGPWTEFTVPGHFDCDEIEVTITPRKSVRERRAEVLYRFYEDARKSSRENHGPIKGDVECALNTLEAIDRGDP